MPESDEYSSKQDMQCMYNVTARRVHATIAAVEKPQVLHNLSVYSWP